ncbi:MAG: 1-acyl-sn-glycerol-3-phosphate acyltransferase [Bernardetiaceae bacterium]|nr:1-acyl-sn-glycerol-3-phosphate acyltransferase [Bernardetiaceae bacterium]
MKLIASWIGTLLFIVSFFLTLLIFHVLQLIALQISYAAHKKTVDLMIYFILFSLRLGGTRIRLRKDFENLPTDRPLLLVSNHQSMFDIPMIHRLFELHHPKYITKKELAKGIPAISLNVRRGGSVLIDRKNPREAVKSLLNFAAYLNKNNYAGCIFPEGTRAYNGKLRKFRTTGMLELLRKMPDAVVVPIAIDNSWQITKNKFKPVPFGINVSCHAMKPIERENRNNIEILEEAERQIAAALGQPIGQEIPKETK